MGPSIGKPASDCTLNHSNNALSMSSNPHFLIFLFVVRLFSNADKICSLFSHKVETVDDDKLNFLHTDTVCFTTS
jgi:hypothetical protein